MSHLQWNRLLWGVVMIMPAGDPVLLGDSWHEHQPTDLRDSEPTRALLFRTRQQARDWCRPTMARWRESGRDWAVRPVRVREVVEPILVLRAGDGIASFEPCPKCEGSGEALP